MAKRLNEATIDKIWSHLVGPRQVLARLPDSVKSAIELD